MKRSLFILLTCLMMVMNTVIILGGNRLLRKEISVYMIQVGRYKEKEYAMEQVSKMEALGYHAGTFLQEDYLVYAEFQLSQEEANTLANTIASQGITCVVKEYRIPEKFKEDIKQHHYESIYSYLKERKEK